MVKGRNIREIEKKRLLAAREKAMSQDEVQIIEGTDERDSDNRVATVNAALEKNSSNGRPSDVHQASSQVIHSDASQGVEIIDIPVPVAETNNPRPTAITIEDNSLAGRTPPLPGAVSIPLPKSISQPIVHNSLAGQTTVNSGSSLLIGDGSNCATSNSKTTMIPAINNVASAEMTNSSIGRTPPIPPPLPPPPPPQMSVDLTIPIVPPAPALPNMSVPPPAVHHGAANAMAKFNTPNNLVPIKSVDPPKPPIVAFKTKSLSRLPLPPGINQNDLESIDSPPSRSPSPLAKGTVVKEPVAGTSSGKQPLKKSIKDLPMPPGLLDF